jgi:hypothetical protein
MLLPEGNGNKYKDYQKRPAELHSSNESFRNSKMYHLSSKIKTFIQKRIWTPSVRQQGKFAMNFPEGDKY